VYLAYLTAQAGGDIYKADAGTKQAFEFAKKLIDEGYFPKDALTWTYDQSNAAYMSDKLATMRQWTFFNDVAPGNTEWYAPEKAVIVDPPAGPAGAKTWAGGWGMAVPKDAKNKDAALKFVAWMNEPDHAVELAQASSFFVTARTSVLDAMGSDGIVAALKHYSESGFVVPRPFHPQAAQAETIVDDIGQSYLTGQIDIDEAMSQLASQIDALG
jgi:multiple sugar transport system substrate-binding protein